VASCRFIRSSLLMFLDRDRGVASRSASRLDTNLDWTGKQILSVDQAYARRWHTRCPFAPGDFGLPHLKDSSPQITPSTVPEKEVC